MTFRVVVFVVLLTVVAASANSHSLDLDMVRRTMAKAMRCYNIEKLQLGVALQDKTQHKIRLQLQPDNSVTELGEGVKFYLASISKGMFGVTLPIIERHLQSKDKTFSLFTTPVKEWFGEDFWFLDHERTKMLTIDDMVSHSTGLARHDYMWYYKGWKTKEEILRHTGRLEANARYRASYLYNNLVWTIADLAVQNLTNKKFTEYMREFLWNPLDMRDTLGSTEVNDNVRSSISMPTSYRSTGLPSAASALSNSPNTVEAAAGIVTTLDDMLKYMQYLIKDNYTSLSQLPKHFLPINSYAGQGAINQWLSTNLPDAPQWETESYARGWVRSWYRDNLLYAHSGHLHGMLGEIDVYLKRGISVFNHMTLGVNQSFEVQHQFSMIFNKFIADLLLQNSSFINEENICFLSADQFITPSQLSIRRLSTSELSTVLGEYGSYAFGAAQIDMNETTNTPNFNYGIFKLELIPVEMPIFPQFAFYTEVIDPVEYRTENVINRTQEYITVPKSTLAIGSFATIQQEREKIILTIQSADMKMEKNLDVNSWNRPDLCPESKTAEKDGRSLFTILLSVTIGIWICH